jgi:hypothetical protein
MDQLEERIIRLEERVGHERERTDYHLLGIIRRVEGLEGHQSAAPQGASSGSIKLLLAVGLTLLAFLATTSPKAVISAARIGFGLP